MTRTNGKMKMKKWWSCIFSGGFHTYVVSSGLYCLIRTRCIKYLPWTTIQTKEPKIWSDQKKWSRSRPNWITGNTFGVWKYSYPPPTHPPTHHPHKQTDLSSSEVAKNPAAIVWLELWMYAMPSTCWLFMQRVYLNHRGRRRVNTSPLLLLMSFISVRMKWKSDADY